MKRLLAFTLALAAVAAAAQSVSLQGMLGRKALLIVDGGAPKSVAPGETYNGIKVLATQGDEATLEIDGRRHTLRVGDAPASVGGRGTGSPGNKIILTAGSGGHFLAQGAINGRAANFLVDTGATTVAMGAPEADRLGIAYKNGPVGRSSTANGVVPFHHVKLASVRIGDVEVYDVDAAVLQQSMPHILLGNSFLTRFQMTRHNDQMVLERRY